MEVVLIIIASILAAQLLVNILMFALRFQREIRGSRVAEEFARESNRIQKGLRDIAETNIARNTRVSDNNSMVIVSYKEALEQHHKHLMTIYALLKGAAKGEISSVDMVKRISDLATLPEDQKATPEDTAHG